MVCIDILYAQKVAQAQRPPESLIVELPGVGHHWETLQKKRSLSELGNNTHLNESLPKVQKYAAPTTPRRKSSHTTTTYPEKSRRSPKKGRKPQARDSCSMFVK